MRITDASGFFTVAVDGLVGAYNWRAKGPNGISGGNTAPGFLANGGAINLTGSGTTQVEMGLMRAGDADNNNAVTTLDFNILKTAFGKAIGEPGYDGRADFNGDNRVNATDFNLLKVNFGLGGSSPLGPGQR